MSGVLGAILTNPHRHSEAVSQPTVACLELK